MTPSVHPDGSRVYTPEYALSASMPAGDILVQGVDFEPVPNADETARGAQNNLAIPARGFHTATAGNVTFVTAFGNKRTLATAAGQVYNIRVLRVLAQGTTATGIVLYL